MLKANKWNLCFFGTVELVPQSLIEPRLGMHVRTIFFSVTLERPQNQCESRVVQFFTLLLYIIQKN